MIKKTPFVFLVLLILILLFVKGEVKANTVEDYGYQNYLPLALKTPVECGVEIWRGGIYQFADQLANLDCQWVRINWGTETQPGLYKTWLDADRDWSTLDGFGAEIQAIKDMGKVPVVVIMGNDRGTCRPLSPDKFSDFAEFVRDLAIRYQISHVEIWNEPDLSGGLPNLFGCWGVENILTFINLLETVRSVVSSETNIGTSFAMSDEEASLLMIQEIVADVQLDFLGLHYYEVYEAGRTSWPILIQRVTKVRSLYTGPVWVSETNLLFGTGECINPTEDFESQQGDFINFALRSSGANAIFGYALVNQSDSWRCTALLKDDLSPLPAYEALQQP